MPGATEARAGFDTMMRGVGDVAADLHNTLQTAIASVTPSGVLARRHAKKAAPGSGE